jgi:hypothetical protein
MFTQTSRYASVASAKYQYLKGRQLTYKLLRLTPDAPTLLTHTVQQQDRLDLLANAYYIDPEQFWRICDANSAMRPEDLLKIGSELKIALVQK